MIGEGPDCYHPWCRSSSEHLMLTCYRKSFCLCTWTQPRVSVPGENVAFGGREGGRETFHVIKHERRRPCRNQERCFAVAFTSDSMPQRNTHTTFTMQHSNILVSSRFRKFHARSSEFPHSRPCFAHSPRFVPRASDTRRQFPFDSFSLSSRHQFRDMLTVNIAKFDHVEYQKPRSNESF